MQIRDTNGVHRWRIYLTTEELLNLANDGITDWFYTNKLRELIEKEALKFGNEQSKSGKEESGDRS